MLAYLIWYSSDNSYLVRGNMTGLKRILQQYGVNVKLGASPLAERLNVYRQRLYITFWVLFCVLVSLIALGAYGLWHLLGCGAQAEITAWAGAVGLAAGSGGLVEVLRRVWSEWASTSLFVTLIAEASQAEINVIVKKAIAGMK
jgi:hypothetical protein